MDLRPPISLEHSYSSTTTATPTTATPNDRKRKIDDDKGVDYISQSVQYQNSYLPLLCRMYVASQAMQLGTEARFTSLVLFHRYVAHFHHLQNNIYDDTDEDEDNDKLAEPTLTSKSVHPMKKIRMKKERCDKAERNHLGTVAAACLFLGCKAQEETRRIRDVINLSHMLDFENDNDGHDDDEEYYEEVKEEKINLTSDRTPSNEHTDEKNNYQRHQNQRQLSKKRIIINEATQPPDLDESYWATKERIVSTEQSILRLIKFDVSVSQPHRILVIVYEELLHFHAYGNDNDADDDEKMTAVLKSAWKRLNDALLYAPALMCGCVELACAALELALEEREYGGKGHVLLQRKNDTHCGWKDCVGVDQHQLEDAKEKLIEASNLLSRIADNDNDL